MSSHATPSPTPGPGPGGSLSLSRGLPVAREVRGGRRPRPGWMTRGSRGSLYRGGAGVWSWVAHRISGVVLFFFLLVHVLDTALVRVSPQAYDAVIQTYKNPVVGVMEVGLVGAFLFHALNGIRIIVIDYWPDGPRYHQPLLHAVLGVWMILMMPFTARHLGFVFATP